MRLALGDTSRPIEGVILEQFARYFLPLGLYFAFII